MPFFSIITPSFNALNYLPLCRASVRDQNIDLEHLVIDGKSTDETVSWLKQEPDLIWTSEKDQGMYDAINKGLKRARGEIISYLNADEQYLPHTLHEVSSFFNKHPETDILFGSMLLIRPNGDLIAYRKAYPPLWSLILTSHLYVFSCAMFFRRKIIDHGFFFNPSLRDTGDWDFVLRILKAGYRAQITQKYLAAFTWTGHNMSAGENAKREIIQIHQSMPWWMKKTKPLFNAYRFGLKVKHRCYIEKKPLTYSIYTHKDLTQRTLFSEANPRFRWVS